MDIGPLRTKLRPKQPLCHFLPRLHDNLDLHQKKPNKKEPTIPKRSLSQAKTVKSHSKTKRLWPNALKNSKTTHSQRLSNITQRNKNSTQDLGLPFSTSFLFPVRFFPPSFPLLLRHVVGPKSHFQLQRLQLRRVQSRPRFEHQGLGRAPPAARDEETKPMQMARDHLQGGGGGGKCCFVGSG